jgi:hypothetical protein
MEIIHCGYQFQFVLIFSVVKIKDNYFIEMLRSLNCAFIDRGFLVRPDTIKCKYIPMLLDKVYEFVEKQKTNPSLLLLCCCLGIPQKTNE